MNLRQDHGVSGSRIYFNLCDRFSNIADQSCVAGERSARENAALFVKKR